jgi:precorrin-2 dehydrogenase/sirohydrochlorin ferrochelatase
MFPLFLNLNARLCAVIGGGPVGRRKAAGLLAAGARVSLVCLEPRPADEASAALTWLQEPYQSSHLDEVSLVFAAATPEVNRRVVRDARERRLWVNAADDLAACDFHIPAVVRRGPFVLAVGTGGAAPGLAGEVRRRLEGQFDDAFGTWVDLLAELRPRVLARVADPETRRAIFRVLSDWSFAERLANEDVANVRGSMLDVIETLAEGPPRSL